MLDSKGDSFTIDVAPVVLPGLRYLCDDGRAIRRRRAGKGFVYLDHRGRRLSDPDIIGRIRSLAIPPAWTEVWICPSPDGHIQATGRDAKGRKQYRYHSAYRALREEAKFEHILAFAEALPTIRMTVAQHMGLRGLPRRKVLATVVHLLETTLIRVGNDDYARRNKSYGLTTLRNEHVEVAGSEVRFQFVGKSGKQWSLAMRDRRVAKVIRACQELPGQELLNYLDDEKELRAVSSGDVNAYLKEVTGRDITAKDFRTWAGTVLMARFLREIGGFDSAAQAKRIMRAAVNRVATVLGNTPTVCRKSYVHPAVPDAYLRGVLLLDAAMPAAGSGSTACQSSPKEEEAALLALLRNART